MKVLIKVQLLLVLICSFSCIDFIKMTQVDQAGVALSDQTTTLTIYESQGQLTFKVGEHVKDMVFHVDGIKTLDEPTLNLQHFVNGRVQEDYFIYTGGDKKAFKNNFNELENLLQKKKWVVQKPTPDPDSSDNQQTLKTDLVADRGMFFTDASIKAGEPIPGVIWYENAPYPSFYLGNALLVNDVLTGYSYINVNPEAKTVCFDDLFCINDRFHTDVLTILKELLEVRWVNSGDGEFDKPQRKRAGFKKHRHY
jgi:hypothetical protein